MEINYNIVSIIDLIGLVQGIVLGTILILINKNKKSTIFLGLAVLSFSLGFLPNTLNELHITKYYPQLLLLPLQNQWILIPLFYVYVQKVSVFSHKKINYWVLYPGLVFLLVQIVLFFLPVPAKIEINDSLWFDLLKASGMLYSISILILMLRHVNKHIMVVENQFSSVEDRTLHWTKYFIYCCFGLALLAIFLIFRTDIDYVRPFFSVAYTAMVFWVSIRGILQHNVPSVISEVKSKRFSEEVLSDDGNQERSDAGLYELVDKINDYMNSSEVFVHTELTIVDLGTALDVHPRRISTAINKICGQNFNSYVNKYRVEKAKELLNGQESDNFSVEGIGSEVGFHSKSAFYSSFKKITGTTPSRYKERFPS